MKKLLTIAIVLIFLASCKKTESLILTKEKNEVTTKDGKSVNIFNGDEQFKSIVSKSVERTFGKSMDYTLVQIDNIEINSKLVSTVIYATENGKSSVLVVTDLLSKKKTIVDCTGTCDCRERLTILPDGTQTFECTCASCKMTVEEVE